MNSEGTILAPFVESISRAALLPAHTQGSVEYFVREEDVRRPSKTNAVFEGLVVDRIHPIRITFLAGSSLD